MLFLNKEKEHLLQEKYNAEKNEREFDKTYYYRINKIFMEGYSGFERKNGRVAIYSTSLATMDTLFDLISDKIIIKKDNPEKITKKKLEQRVEELEEEIKKLKGIKNVL